MLTCKIENNTINTIDYSSDEIRKWSNKSILKCPLCNSEVIYKHGDIKIPHFAHKVNSECENVVGEEPNTDEHLQSIKDIYLRLKEIEKINKKLTNVELEYWIKETRQRADISFIYNNQRYVIEVQCSPQATKFLERKKLYELSGVKDIWILGTEKYEEMTTDNYYKTKEIERELLYTDSQLLFYYNYQDKKFKYVSNEMADAILDRKTAFEFHFEEIDLNEINIELLIKTEYNNKINSINKWIEGYVNKNFINKKENYYIQEIDKNVLCYFEDYNGNKYVIDYINEYLNESNYFKLKNQYIEIGINPIILIDQNYYLHAINDNQKTDLNRTYNKLSHADSKIKDFISSEMIFINDKNICMIKEDYQLNKNYNKEMKNLIYNYEFFLDKQSKLEIINNHENQDVFYQKVNSASFNISKKIKRKTIQSILITNNNFIFDVFEFNELIISNFKLRQIKDLNLYNDEKKLIKSIESEDVFESVKEVLLSDSKKWIEIYIKKQNEMKLLNKTYDNFKAKLKKIFDLNKEIIIDYDLKYSIPFDKQNEYTNLIYFKDNKKNKYIIYVPFVDYMHNIYGEYFNTSNLPKLCQSKFTFLSINLTDKFVENFYLCNDYSTERLSITDRLVIAEEQYEFKDNNIKLLNTKNIKFFYKRNKTINENIRFVYLRDFNYIDVAEELCELQNDLFDEKVSVFMKLKETCIFDSKNKKIYEANSSKVSFKIYVLLKEIIEVCKKVKNKDVYIMLNPHYTKENNGKFELWKINEFISSLKEIGITNVENLMKGAYND